MSGISGMSGMTALDARSRPRALAALLPEGLRTGRARHTRRLATALGAGLLALLLASSGHALSLSGVELSIASTSSSGSGGTTFDGSELANASDPSSDTDPSDDDLFLTEGDLDLTSADLGSSGTGLDYYGPSGNWRVSDWELDIEGDPFLGAVVAVANLSSQAQTFDVTLDVPVAEVSPLSLMDGSVANVLDLVLGTFSDDGSPLYVARLDENDQPGTELLPNPFSVTAPSTIPGDSFSGVVGPATSESIGIRWRFELDGGSAALFSSSLNVVAVPEPSTLLLCGLGLALAGLVGRHERA